MRADVDAKAVNDLAPLVLLGAWGLVLIAETVRPMRPRAPGERLRHLGRNLAVVAGGLLINFFHAPALALAGGWVRAQGFGLLPALSLPLWADTLLGVVLLDLADYWRHRVHHHFPPFWKLHQVHHLDEAVDSSTGLLNHPFEVFSSLLVVGPAMVLFGASPLALAVRVMVGMSLIVLHHSNLALPKSLDAALRLVTPTPATHRVHHLRHAVHSDSNYGTCFTWWDRLFGTWQLVPDIATRDTGLDAYPRQSAGAMLLHPFRRKVLGRPSTSSG
jgi:sterol desaturase/sphingolipid hydroxylase (fatty acid hydroxylase superfamily)